MIEDVMNNQDDIKKTKDISNLSDLSQAEKTLNEEPKTPKLIKIKVKNLQHYLRI